MPVKVSMGQSGKPSWVAAVEPPPVLLNALLCFHVRGYLPSAVYASNGRGRLSAGSDHIAKA